MSYPLISIITINYNDKVGLERTLKSVTNQTFRDFEYIVIDGGSTDGSKELIEQYQAKIDYWVSEPDKGIYNAMNKGITKAKGEYLLFLNGGDVFSADNVLQENINQFGDYEIVYFNVILGRNNPKIVTYPTKLSFNFFYHQTICHQAIFFKKELFEKYGMYDEELKTKSDWKFLILTICKYNVSYIHVNKAITIYDVNGMSSNEKNIPLLKEENELVLKNEFPLILENIERLNVLEKGIEELKKSKIIKLLNGFGRLKFIGKL